MPAPKLVAVGIVAAAISAGLAILLQLTLVNPRYGAVAPSASATCVVASRDIPAGHRLSESDLDQTALDAQPAGESLIATRALAVGRVLSVALSKGQALRSADLVAPGPGTSIAGQLEPGMRAITVSLRDYGPEVVLYPGALVDMLATLERPARTSDQRETVTITLLEAVRVLAVNDEAVGTKTHADPTVDRRAVTRKLTVTLAVTPEQAAEVELASARGTIGITLRPDQERGTARSTGVSVTSRSILGLPEIPATPPQGTAAADQPKPEVPTAKADLAPPVWRVNVTRGDVTTTHAIPESSRRSAPQQTTPTP